MRVTLGFLMESLLAEAEGSAGAGMSLLGMRSSPVKRRQCRV